MADSCTCLMSGASIGDLVRRVGLRCNPERPRLSKLYSYSFHFPPWLLSPGVGELTTDSCHVECMRYLYEKGTCNNRNLRSIAGSFSAFTQLLNRHRCSQ